MNTFTTILLAILTFGVLILIHEFGHYIFARIFGVTVKEFSIGMGPKLLWYDSKKTGIRYTVAALPIGGFVSMAGEDEESSDPNAFNKKPAWQRFIITAAGATINILAGFLAMTILCSLSAGEGKTPLGTTVVHSFVESEQLTHSSEEYGLQVGDKILEVYGKKVSILDELKYEIMRHGDKPIDLLVERTVDGKKQTLPINDVVFPTAVEQEQTFGQMDFYVFGVEQTFGSVLSHAFQKSVLIVRMCWESIFDLITGRYTLAAVSGPVGISSAIGDAARLGFSSFLYIVALISINLGVMNLLPLPALDGGRLLCLLIEMITRKKIPPRVESMIHGIGLILLLGLSVVIMFKDVFQLLR
ncbi:MAG: site-2 protease family protein [Clostridia bacterium]|nr:site-2 protease family protein [Clostridia bacterium]